MSVSTLMRSDNRALAAMIAGTTSGILAMYLVAPLDQFITKQHVQTDSHWKTVVNEMWANGVGAIYAHTKSGFWKEIISESAFWYAYEHLRNLYARRYLSSDIPIASGLLIGYTAAVCSSTASCPITTLNIRMQAASDTSTWEVARSMKPMDFIRGLGASYLLCVNPAITYMLYDQFSRYLAKRRGTRPLSPLQGFWLGFLAKTMSTCITYPAILVKKRQMVGVTGGVMDIIKGIYAKHGILGFYKSMLIHIVKTGMSAACKFSLKETLTRAALMIVAMRAAFLNKDPVLKTLVDKYTRK